MRILPLLKSVTSFGFLLFCTAACAQSAMPTCVRRPIPAVKTSAPPIIDGDLSDPCWKRAPKAQVFIDQQQGTAAPDQTEARILYDAKYIYIAFYCKDSQPNLIVARETVRDSFATSTEDNVEVTFDPFLTYQRGDLTTFCVNPLGTRSARIAGGRATKAEWEGDWDAAAKRMPDGWTVEMRIPWDILNYPLYRKPTRMGINFWRWQQRTRIQSVWSNIGPQSFNELEGVWTQVEVPQNAFHPHLSLLPYSLGLLSKSGSNQRFGLDARYSFSPELTGVASINPDFGTIEGAVESIAFSRSEQYVPETRPFFLEGSDYFGGLFYSDRIQSFDAGTKLYGKIAPTDTLGFLNTVDFGNRTDTVMNLRHTFSPTASASLFLNQLSMRTDNNTVGQLSGSSRWGNFSVGGMWALSSGHEAGGDAKSFYTSYRDNHLYHWLEYQDYAPQFRAADGLVSFTDLKGFDIWENYRADWHKGFWQGFRATLTGQYQWHRDGLPFQRGGGLDMYFSARQDWRLGLHAYYNRFDAQTDNTYGFDFMNGQSNRFRQWGFSFTAGRLASQPSMFFGPSFSLRLFRRLDVIYGGAIQNLAGVEAQHILTLNYELSPTRAIGGRLVTNNGAVNGYLSYRNSGGRGMNYFIMLGDPNAPSFVKRIAVKFIFPM